MLYRRAPFLLLAALALPACHDDDDDNGGSGGGGTPTAPRSDGTLTAALSGNQEAPPVLTFADGAASFFIPANRDRLQFTVSTFNLTGITMAHIHLGPIGVDGPIIFDLATSPFVGTVQGTLTASDLQPRPGASTFAEALDAVLRGAAYVNVHTLAYPDGEIRGQIGPGTFRAVLDGSRVLPGVATAGTGTAGVSLNADQTEMAFTLDVAGLTGPPTAARIHVGPPGLNGPAIFTLSSTMFDTRLTGAVSAANLQPQPTVDVLTFPEAVDALLSGNAYVLVSTPLNPGGEIRGQLVPGPLPTPVATPPATAPPVTPPPTVVTPPTPVAPPTVNPPVGQFPLTPAPVPGVTVIPPVGAPIVMPVMMLQPGLPPVSSPSVPQNSNLLTPATTPIFGPAINPAVPPFTTPSVPPASNVIVPPTTPVFGPATNFTVQQVPTTTFPP